MSFYRSLITAFAAMGLATSVFAADDATTTTTTTQAPADAAAPAPEAAAPAAATTTTTATTDAVQDKVNVNTATAKDLMKVKGMTAAKAKAVVSYRKKHGDFKSLDELKDVSGFKKMKDDAMKAIQDQLTTG